MTRKQFFAALPVATLGAVATIAAALAQNSSPQAAPASIVQSYDATNEIVVKGTVEKVVDAAQAPENISGAHLFVITEQGTIDVHLGPSPSWKAQNLTLTPGEAVELTGVMTNFEGKSVLLARTLKTDNRIAILRNEHGIPTRVSGARSVNAAPLRAKGGRP
jgi:DNA/RNA endonuclease YhcR with UshA esterase domain